MDAVSIFQVLLPEKIFESKCDEPRFNNYLFFTGQLCIIIPVKDGKRATYAEA